MLDKMQQELKSEGHTVNFAAINSSDAVDNQKELIDQCSFPLFQDTDEVGAWGLHRGQKDDFFIYDAAGKLTSYLPFSGTISTDLSSIEGYKNVKEAILKAE